MANQTDYSLLSTLEIGKDITGKAVDVLGSMAQVVTSASNLTSDYLDTIRISNKATMRSEIELSVTKNLVKKQKLLSTLGADESITSEVTSAMESIASLLE